MDTEKTRGLFERLEPFFVDLRNEFGAINSIGIGGWIDRGHGKVKLEVLVILSESDVSNEVRAEIRTRIQAMEPGVSVDFFPEPEA